MSSVFWQKPNDTVNLCPMEIHIWKVYLTQGNDLITQVLSKDELIKAHRFIQPTHQRRFAMARAYLRIILSKYTGLNPAKICFKEGPYGKLFLAGNSLLQFNLSHSHDVAIYAFCLNKEVGIDMEWINHNLEIEPLIKRFYQPEDQHEILNLPHELQHEAFFELWTCKEAYLKALGVGLSGLSNLIPREMQEMTQNYELEPGFSCAVAIMDKISDYIFIFNQYEDSMTHSL